MAKQILVVDDEVGMLEVCADTLRRHPDAKVATESDARRALERLDKDRFDLLIVDNRMPEITGIELLRHARESQPHLSAIMITAFPCVETAVAAMKLGAADYLVKPFLPEDLLAVVTKLLETQRLREENQLLQRRIAREGRFGDLIGSSPPMLKVFEAIDSISGMDVDVLITGETGTGKDLVARSIHARSKRSKRRFVPVDCGALPEDLLESELFGHERGAFTGAHARSLGLLEYADQGTFFFDEIGELPIHLQAKLLRALQERRVRRVGGTEEISVDIRVISATARDLDAEVREGRFRSDLFYRINVARVELPPLRARAGDLPLLVDHFIGAFAEQTGRSIEEVDEDVLEVLAQYSWPGNVRELQNVIKRAMIRCSGRVLTIEDIPDEVVMGPNASAHAPAAGFFDLRKRELDRFERDFLVTLLQRNQGDVSRAARDASLPRGTLYRFLKNHDLDPNMYRM